MANAYDALIAQAKAVLNVTHDDTLGLAIGTLEDIAAGNYVSADNMQDELNDYYDDDAEALDIEDEYMTEEQADMLGRADLSAANDMLFAKCEGEAFDADACAELLASAVRKRMAWLATL